MSFSARLIWVALVSLSTATSVMAGPVDDAMQADRAFAKMAQDKGVAEAFGAYAAPNAIKFGPGEQIRGPADIRASMAKDSGDGSKLNWEPKEGVASADGTLVAVWGRWIYTGPAGSNVLVNGTYLTVWARQADGSWKFTHDIGNADPKPKAP